MANVKISQLPAATTPVTGIEVLPIVQAGNTVKVTTANVMSQSLIGQALFPRTAAEIAASVTPVNYAYPECDARRYGAIGDNGVTDNATPFSQLISVALLAKKPAYIFGAAGWYKSTASFAVTGAVSIIGDGINKTNIRFFDCDGVVISAAVSDVAIENMQLFSVDSAGTPDPKTKIGIDINGVSGSTCNRIRTENLFLRGWATCIDYSYTWSSLIDTIYTLNCDTGVRYFGQSVNNSITNSFIAANGGTYCIRTEKDGAVQGEGLMVTNSLLAQGAYGIHSTGFLSLRVSNSVIDLITDTAFYLVNVPSLGINNCWIYAANYGVRFANLSVSVAQKASIVGCDITASDANGRAIQIGANNIGVNIVGCSLTAGPSGTSRCLYVESSTDDISIYSSYLSNLGPNPSIYVGSAGFRNGGLTGVDSIQYAAQDSFTATLTGCTTSPTGSVTYTVNGDLVTLQIPAITGTSNTTAATLTGMPTAIRPIYAGTQTIIGVAQDNGIEAISRMQISTGGVITLNYGVSATFTNSGTKGVGACSVTYRAR